MRIFLLFALIVSLIPVTSHARFLPVTIDKNLTFEQAKEQILYLDSITDRLPDSAYPSITTQQDLEAWILEIVPFFGYEGITGSEMSNGPYGGYTYPKMVEFSYFDERGSQGQHHTLGMADCVSGKLWMNARLSNPVSSLYDRGTTLSILVHELAHINGICYAANSEQSAQLVTLEILAAMTTKGNLQTFGPLMSTLKGMYMSAAHAIALRDGRTDEYTALVEEVANSPFEVAIHHKSTRYWSDDQARMMDILLRYNLEPMNDFTRALYDETCVYQSVIWDTEIDDVVLETYTINSYCIEGVLLPINMHVFSHPLVIDDLHYVIENAEAITDFLVQEDSTN